MTQRDVPPARWAPVVALGGGTFVLVTTELLPVGVLAAVGATMEVSDGAAGLIVTVPGLVAAASAPIVAATTARRDRRQILCVLMTLLVVANLAAALASNFPLLLLARSLAGVSIGGFWTVAGGLGPRLVPADAGRATAVIFGGVALASVVGIPAGAVLGDLLGWRTAFAAAAGAAASVLTALLYLLPSLPAVIEHGRGTVRRQLGNRGVRLGLTITAALVTGHFTAYTFLDPLVGSAGGSTAPIGTLLALFGGAGVVGNFLAGATPGRHVRRTAAAISLGLGIALLALPVTVGGPATTMTVAAWGLAWGGVSVTSQRWVLVAAPDDTEAATSLVVVVFNLAVAVGAFTGGRALDLLGPSLVPWVGAAIVLLAAWPLWAARDRLHPRTVHPGDTDPESPVLPHHDLHPETCR